MKPAAGSYMEVPGHGERNCRRIDLNCYCWGVSIEIDGDLEKVND